MYKPDHTSADKTAATKPKPAPSKDNEIHQTLLFPSLFLFFSLVSRLLISFSRTPFPNAQFGYQCLYKSATFFRCSKRQRQTLNWCHALRSASIRFLFPKTDRTIDNPLFSGRELRVLTTQKKKKKETGRWKIRPLLNLNVTGNVMSTRHEYVRNRGTLKRDQSRPLMSNTVSRECPRGDRFHGRQLFCFVSFLVCFSLFRLLLPSRYCNFYTMFPVSSASPCFVCIFFRDIVTFLLFHFFVRFVRNRLLFVGKGKEGGGVAKLITVYDHGPLE